MRMMENRAYWTCRRVVRRLSSSGEQEGRKGRLFEERRRFQVEQDQVPSRGSQASRRAMTSLPLGPGSPGTCWLESSGILHLSLFIRRQSTSSLAFDCISLCNCTACALRLHGDHEQGLDHPFTTDAQPVRPVSTSGNLPVCAAESTTSKTLETEQNSCWIVCSTVCGSGR